MRSVSQNSGKVLASALTLFCFFALTGCGNGSGNDSAFSPNAGVLAHASGAPAVCLGVIVSPGRKFFAVDWPMGYRSALDPPRLVGPDRKVVAELGQPVGFESISRRPHNNFSCAAGGSRILKVSGPVVGATPGGETRP